MRRKIVRGTSPDEPGRCCRLWEKSDVHHVLTESTATEVIEAMTIRESNKMLSLNAGAFSKMKKLRLLKVSCLTHCDDLNYLSNKLRLLDWRGYPLRSLPSGFQPDDLVALLLPCSHIEQLWKGNISLYKLEGCNKVGNLSGSLQQAGFLEELDLSETAITEPPNPKRKDGVHGCDVSFVVRFEFINERLKLRDCNLCEGDIPSDISCLSSLRSLDLGDLDLSGNNFVSINPSLTRLSKIKHHGLSNCRELKSLPQLVTNISGTHYYRLAENANAFTLLKKILKVFANSRKLFTIIIPGNEIPEGFSHQRVDSSVKIPLPLNIQNDSQWMGVTLCCIFLNDDTSRDESIGYKAVIHRRNSGQAACDESAFLDGYDRGVDESGFLLDYSNQDCDELELSSRFGPGDNFVKVKKCGVRIVYEKDLKDVQLVKEQSSNPSFVEIEEMNEDSPADGSIAKGPLGKRKHDIYEGMEAGPQPKRIEKFFHFLMGRAGKKH
ncbi:hypothetical protein V6N13_087968 [Hibiscus sabdariffa]|uniref:C-JID domain-containing protein n=1 Tax=Hibiscus sabdariffa TaxID=183260 RepID=A0ABR2FYR4_9ROSI